MKSVFITLLILSNLFMKQFFNLNDKDQLINIQLEDWISNDETVEDEDNFPVQEDNLLVQTDLLRTKLSSLCESFKKVEVKVSELQEDIDQYSDTVDTLIKTEEDAQNEKDTTGTFHTFTLHLKKTDTYIIAISVFLDLGILAYILYRNRKATVLQKRKEEQAIARIMFLPKKHIVIQNESKECKDCEGTHNIPTTENPLCGNTDEILHSSPETQTTVSLEAPKSDDFSSSESSTQTQIPEKDVKVQLKMKFTLRKLRRAIVRCCTKEKKKVMK
ncbi:uncharacterized protein LOC116411599 [Xenopus tropicalis]|uniref:Uncharacterized protein LOC116411599 n=1 Tax=Xenopus tropicalis TaxID=8364 RepID=A0A8J1JTW9_XENTR|nr:uncharacterized protein LOC116411599 [Xenopus tropicalis]